LVTLGLKDVLDAASGINEAKAAMIAM